jgi:hypothetical protein
LEKIFFGEFGMLFLKYFLNFWGFLLFVRKDEIEDILIKFIELIELDLCMRYLGFEII